MDFGVSQGDGNILFPTDEEFSRIVNDSQRGVPLPNGGYSPFFEKEENSLHPNIYPTMTFQRVWTSSPVPKEPNGVYIFNSHYGLFQRWYRDAKEPFLCVFDPNKKSDPIK